MRKVTVNTAEAARPVDRGGPREGGGPIANVRSNDGDGGQRGAGVAAPIVNGAQKTDTRWPRWLSLLLSRWNVSRDPDYRPPIAHAGSNNGDNTVQTGSSGP